MEVQAGKHTLKQVQEAFIKETLELHNYNRTHTAKALGIGVRTLQRHLKINANLHPDYCSCRICKEGMARQFYPLRG